MSSGLRLIITFTKVRAINIQYVVLYIRDPEIGFSEIITLKPASQ